MTRSIVCLSVVSSLLFSPDLRASKSAAGARLRGTVLSPGGHPVGHARVALIKSADLQVGERLMAGTVRPTLVEADSAGVFRIEDVKPGVYIVVGAAPVGAVVNQRSTSSPNIEQRATFVPTFYPGTATSDQAKSIRLFDGTVIDDLDFKLEQRSTFITRVHIVSQVPVASTDTAVSVLPLSVPLVLQRLRSASPVTIEGADVASISGLTAGRHVISVVQRRNAFETLVGRLELEVTQDTDTSLTLQRSGTISVHAAFAEGLPTSTLPRMALTVLARSEDGAMFVAGSARSQADGSFEVSDLPDGQYRLVPSLQSSKLASSAPLTIGSVLVDGSDRLDQPFEVLSGQHVNAGVTVVADGPIISGRVSDAAARSETPYIVVALSTDRRFWLAGSSRIRHVLTSSSGQYMIAGLPSGEYTFSAVRSLPDDWSDDRELLARIVAASATRVAVPQHGVVRLDLSIGPTNRELSSVH